MRTIDIRYIFHLDNHRQETIDLHLDKQTMEPINQPEQGLPDWADLSFHQCPHCTLDVKEHPSCPVAANISHVIGRFDNITSYDEIDLEVVTETRRVTQHTTAQRGISSLLGLLFAVSGCPHTNYLKPMARFHLPLANEDETIYRAGGMYLLAQYFLKREEKDGDLELTGLTQIYQNLHLVNTSIAQRIKSFAHTDSSTNAVVILDTFTNIMPFVIEEHMDEIRHLFSAYLSEPQTSK
jgi:Domain of unknown function (DUF6901)